MVAFRDRPWVTGRAIRLIGTPGGCSGRGRCCTQIRPQLAALDAALAAGPLATGWTDQQWTLARTQDLVAAKFREQYTIPGIWYLLRRRGWTCQIGARRAIESDDGAVEVWKKETLIWASAEDRRQQSAGRMTG
jgi:Winged helix-turn helix